VECVVADNGPGIPAPERERVFDPFYSTKQPGEGTGLGLSNALRFAEELDGTLVLDADVLGRGSVFVLRLPAVVADRESLAIRL
jgi:two-component system cell cycle sensor histidine kinase/response regulator CckA